MPVDHIRYDILAQDALRGLVREVLADAAKRGLPGDHHFFISFDTRASGVRLSQRLLEQYPEEMTVVLQHQFWDLKVTEDAFEVGLSFGGVAERLFVPFAAIKGFVDPSVQFALQFESIPEVQDATSASPAAEVGKAPDKDNVDAGASPAPAARRETSRTSVPASPPAPAGEPAAEPDDKHGAEVVRLDRFRKK